MAAPDISSSIPNALRLVRRMGGTPPSFSDYPHSFSIPGHTLDDAHAFVKAMQATVLWIHQKTTRNDLDTVTPDQPKPIGQRTEHLFKIEYRCPCYGHHEPTPNSQKKVKSRKIGCTARFTVSHHVLTKSLRVVWWWDHNHNPYSHEDMAMQRRPHVVNQWLNKQVVAGLGWHAIEKLLSCPDLFQLDESVAVREGCYIRYDHVRHLIRKRIKVLSKKHDNVFSSLRIWNSDLASQGWNTFLPFQESSDDWLFAFQCPWQKEMMITYGTGMLMVDATHNSVSNYCFSDGRKGSGCWQRPPCLLGFYSFGIGIW
ncbi:uncharacterized protein PGTG_06056 [Puccinia graminis f. sp. tritici CRL 75-36-700-3]|uniref:Uncharacterized protein n=1 Tax=Puccinia graminis f. sp. tritici (strain CRL 75-36-700-3 / race SCCL) TaxID=418459 RepID=E3K5D9_PUCGT|nr:uncharacterized protein PGTG_06056 [Puccinia graminis f. sp. tritici CRL 75-36-700-3]EFP79735.2 hypothetical protein PGTG_06056 [Puccinia graminis f. sp. tritici CRL 75-36-700-3]